MSNTATPFFETVKAEAFAQATQAFEMGEVPVGAVLFHTPTLNIISLAHNRCETDRNSLAHAEFLALSDALQKLGTKYLDEYDLYVTLEPCAFCAAAISLTRLRRLYFGALDPKGGAVEHGPRLFTRPTCLHKPEVYGEIGAEKSQALLQKFFQKIRGNGSL